MKEEKGGSFYPANSFLFFFSRERFESTIEVEVRKGMESVEKEVVEVLGKGDKQEEETLRRILAEQQQGLEERVLKAVNGNRLAMEQQFRQYLHSKPQHDLGGSAKAEGPQHPPRDHRPMYVNQIAHGQYEQAFKHALEEKNIADVVWLCMQVQPSNPAVKLSSVVLLPLLHQLCFSFGAREHVGVVGLKVKWMQRAAMNLSSSDPFVGRHVPSVCGFVKNTLVGKKVCNSERK